jgi:DNA-binding MurR/RpiR family transcriptional regulator
MYSVQKWLNERAEEYRLTGKSREVVAAIASQPSRASYASAKEVAEMARANVASVVRAAQALGFDGWPVLRQELRARYLAALSAPEIAAQHGDELVAQPFDASLQRDIAHLAEVSRWVDREALSATVEAVVRGHRTLIIGSGSYSAVCQVLAHNIAFAGYAVDAPADSPAIATSVARLTADDTLIAVGFWRLYETTVRAAESAHARGATVCAITDSTGSPLAEIADHRIVVPAEGVVYFASLTAAIAVANGICAEIAAHDAERTKQSINRAEEEWQNFRLVRLPPRTANNTERTNSSEH